MERLILRIKRTLAFGWRTGKAFFRNPVKFVITASKQLERNMSEFRPGGFKILPPIIKNLLIINVLVFLAQNVSAAVFRYPLEHLFALHYWQSSLFEPYQLITHLFMHGSLGHIFFNMFALWMFGSILENIWGPKRFLIFFFVCGIGAALCFLAVQTFQFHKLPGTESIGYMTGLRPGQFYNANPGLWRMLVEPTLGASGAIFGLLVAFGYLFPNSLIYLYFFVPIKAKWFVLGYIVLELYLGVQNSATDNVAHFAHLGCALFGFILMKIWSKRNRRNFY
jgi:membrane associated rhomboid family serine protease